MHRGSLVRRFEVVAGVRHLSFGRIVGNAAGENGCARMQIDNPSKKNAMTLSMYKQIPEVISALQIENSSAVRSVVMSGADGTSDFGAGSDISEFPSNRTGPEQSALYSEIEDSATRALLAIPVPLIASIKGACIGGGLNLALTADVRIAGESSKFAVPPARLGIGYPAELMKLLVQAVGEGNAKDLLFSGRILTAAEAHRVGLVTRLVPDADLDSTVEAYVKNIANMAPLTIKAAKVSINTGINSIEAVEATQRCFESRDYVEGVGAFIEKRHAVFEGH